MARKHFRTRMSSDVKRKEEYHIKWLVCFLFFSPFLKINYLRYSLTFDSISFPFSFIIHHHPISSPASSFILLVMSTSSIEPGVSLSHQRKRSYKSLSSEKNLVRFLCILDDISRMETNPEDIACVCVSLTLLELMAVSTSYCYSLFVCVLCGSIYVCILHTYRDIYI